MKRALSHVGSFLLGVVVGAVMASKGCPPVPAPAGKPETNPPPQTAPAVNVPPVAAPEAK